VRFINATPACRPPLQRCGQARPSTFYISTSHDRGHHVYVLESGLEVIWLLQRLWLYENRTAPRDLARSIQPSGSTAAYLHIPRHIQKSIYGAKLETKQLIRCTLALYALWHKGMPVILQLQLLGGLTVGPHGHSRGSTLNQSRMVHYTDRVEYMTSKDSCCLVYGENTFHLDNL